MGEWAAENAGLLTATLTSVVTILAVILLVIQKLAVKFCCPRDQQCPLPGDEPADSPLVQIGTPRRQLPYAPLPYKAASAPDLIWDLDQTTGEIKVSPLKPVPVHGGWGMGKGGKSMVAL